jgi:hypothetical protein
LFSLSAYIVLVSVIDSAKVRIKGGMAFAYLTLDVCEVMPAAKKMAVVQFEI